MGISPDESKLIVLSWTIRTTRSLRREIKRMKFRSSFSCRSENVSIETLMDKIKPVVTKNYRFEHRKY